MKSWLLLSIILLFTINRGNALQAPTPPPVSGTPGPSISTPNPNSTTPPPAVSPVSPAAPQAKFEPAPDAVFWTLFGAMTFVVLVGIVIFAGILRADKNWTFAGAMCGPDRKPSSSRVIAFLGFVVIIAVILGIGYASVWAFLKTGQLPSLTGASTFLVACAGLFAPYFANQIAQAVSGQAPPKDVAPVAVQSSSPSSMMASSGIPNVTFGQPVSPISN